MKLANAVLILILSIIIQASFIGLLDLLYFSPNLPLVLLFLLCYSLSYEKVLFLSIFMGIAYDLFSSISFGSTSLAALGALSLSFYLKKNIFKRGKFADFLSNSLVTFIVFYCLLYIAIIFLKVSTEYAAILNLININLASELLLNFALSVLAYYLIGYFKNKPNPAALLRGIRVGILR